MPAWATAHGKCIADERLLLHTQQSTDLKKMNAAGCCFTYKTKNEGSDALANTGQSANSIGTRKKADQLPVGFALTEKSLALIEDWS